MSEMEDPAKLFDLSGKQAIITGAGGGLGTARPCGESRNRHAARALGLRKSRTTAQLLLLLALVMYLTAATPETKKQSDTRQERQDGVLTASSR